MTTRTPQLASVFRRLRRAVLVRRLWRLDPALRLELALPGVPGGAAIAWRVRLLLDQPARTRAAAASGVVVFASHVVETAGRLRDQVAILHPGRVVRTLYRPARDGPEPGSSSLEREFLSVILKPPFREIPA